MTPGMVIPKKINKTCYFVDASSGDSTNCISVEWCDFRPGPCQIGQDNLRKEKSYHKFTRRMLDGRFQR